MANADNSTRKELRSKYPKKSLNVGNNKNRKILQDDKLTVSDGTDSVVINSDNFDDKSSDESSINTKKRKITAHGKKDKNNSSSKGGKRQKFTQPISDKLKVLDGTDSVDRNSDNFDDKSSDDESSINTKKGKITAHGKKDKNNSSSKGGKRQKFTQPISESSGSDPEINFLMDELPSVIEKIPLVTQTQQSSSSSYTALQDQMNNSLKDLNRTVEKQYQMLLTRMSQLSSQMIELKLAVQQLEKTKVNCDVNSDFEQNWKLLLPCNTKEEFQEFDNKIKTDQDFRQKLAQKFINLINKRTTIARNVGEIMRFCLSRDLALKFNPVKPSEGKLFTFVNTNLYNVVKASLLSTFSSTENAMSESEVRKVVSAVLHHARDWEGGRVTRQKKILPQD